MAHDFLCLCNMKIAACSSAGGDATALHVTPQHSGRFPQQFATSHLYPYRGFINVFSTAW